MVDAEDIKGIEPRPDKAVDLRFSFTCPPWVLTDTLSSIIGAVPEGASMSMVVNDERQDA